MKTIIETQDYKLIYYPDQLIVECISNQSGDRMFLPVALLDFFQKNVEHMQHDIFPETWKVYQSE